MRVLVCGTRTWTDRNIIWSVLTGLYDEESCGWLTLTADPFTVIEGGAPGADRMAADWVTNLPARHGPPVGHPEADDRAMPVAHERFPAQWDRYGRAAGPIRNKQMIDEGRPDMVVAFGSGRGTDDMVKRAVDAGIPTYRILREDVPAVEEPPRKYRDVPFPTMKE